MRVFKTKWLERFARKQKLSDDNLAKAVEEVEQDLNDGDLGGGLVKKRVARAGSGKSGGYRMLIAYQKQDRAVFLYGFAKSARENIKPDELATLKNIAAGFLDADEKAIARALADGTLMEVDYGAQDDEEDE